MPDAKKIALITGANKGIGFEIARQLGAKDVLILVGARDKARGQEAAANLQAEGIEAQFVPLDVTDQASIDAAASYIDKTYGKLDILVNNAAISVSETRALPSQLDIADLRATYDTNVFGVFAVTKALLPLLRRSEAGRIVNMGSTMGSLGRNSDPGSPLADLPPLLAYNSSKTAVNAITVFFASELRKTNLKINSADPGYCSTDLNNHSGWRSPEQGAKIAVELATLSADGPTGGFFEDNGAVPW